MGLHPEGKNAVGIGHCDKCDMRLFAEDTLIIIEGEIICEYCIEEMDEDEQ